MSPATLIFGILGLCGVVYSIMVTSRLRIQTSYNPEFEDWMFHCVLPFAASTTLAVSAHAVHLRAYIPMFGVRGAALLLLFTGIHNAWDAATYHVFVVRPRRDAERNSD